MGRFHRAWSQFNVRIETSNQRVDLLRAGHGLELASSVLVADSVANGVLVPYRAEISLPGARYVAAWNPGHERRSPVKEFLAWLEQEAVATPKG
ncbi:LysR substrate-binding domain-containing protein [Pseudomonas sp. NA-150]|uniref:LysR substrate-binding domain-containing protein n=1 Tax=Pseudomonas sp. NA-150 TaxID=3367525 RepID=UPI0037CA32D8